MFLSRGDLVVASQPERPSDSRSRKPAPGWHRDRRHEAEGFNDPHAALRVLFLSLIVARHMILMMRNNSSRRPGIVPSWFAALCKCTPTGGRGS